MTIKAEFLPQGGTRREKTAEQIAAAAPFDYAATQVGVVGNITVSYDPALGAQGLALAQRMLNVVAGPYNDMEMLFGIAGGAVTLVIAPLSGNNNGYGGAYHFGCNFGVMYCDATFANTTVDPLQLEIALYVAELCEMFMGPQNLGWGCGFSNGEGLSRFLAKQETPAGTLDAFTSGPSWAQAGFPDWVSQTEQTDGDYASTGCAIVYIYWMRALGYTIDQIVQGGGATLAQNYQNLTGNTTAYQDLYNAVNGLQVTTDNPFGNLYGMSESPSAVLWKGGISVLHQGISDNGQLWYTYTNGAANSTEDTLVPVLALTDSPSAVVYNDLLYVFHQGGGNEGRLRYVANDGTNWSGDTLVPNLGMSGSPSAVLWAGGISVFHQGNGDDQSLWYDYFDGTNWYGDTPVPNVRITGSPSAVVYNGLLYVFYQGGSGYNGQLWYSVFDGTNWGQNIVHNVGMSASPSAVVYNGVLFIFHQGGNDGQLWYTAFDGTNWGEDTYLRNLGNLKPAATLLAAA